MAKLVRYQKCGCFHFVTFSCYRRQPLLASVKAYGIFEAEFEAVRRRYGFVVAGYVLMPEHVHLLVGEPSRSPLSVVLQVLKQQTSRRLKQRGATRFWQRRYYDFNVWSDEKRVEKLRYMAGGHGLIDLSQPDEGATGPSHLGTGEDSTIAGV